MPKLREIPPRPVEALEPYLRKGAAEAVVEVCRSLNQFDPLPYGVIPDLLTDEGVEMLESLKVPRNGKCPEETLMAHPVGGPLARTMGNISLANMDMRHESKRTVCSLKNETGEDLTLEPHRDLLDGHAVLFNYAVSGDLSYVLDGAARELKDNELVVLNGAAIWGDINSFLPGKGDSDPVNGWRTLGGVTMVHAVVGTKPASGKRSSLFMLVCIVLLIVLANNPL